MYAHIFWAFYFLYQLDLNFNSIFFRFVTNQKPVKVANLWIQIKIECKMTKFLRSFGQLQIICVTALLVHFMFVSFHFAMLKLHSFDSSLRFRVDWCIDFRDLDNAHYLFNVLMCLVLHKTNMRSIRLAIDIRDVNTKSSPNHIHMQQSEHVFVLYEFIQCQSFESNWNAQLCIAFEQTEQATTITTTTAKNWMQFW